MALTSEVDRVVDATKFNEKALLDGTFTGIYFQVGATTDPDSRIEVSISDLSVSATEIVDSTGAKAHGQLSVLDSAINTVNTYRAQLGAIQNRMEGVLTQLASARESTEAARSRIMDADYAAETANLSRAQILQQAGVAMLAQANALPQNVLTLLQ
jgi:flagellin